MIRLFGGVLIFIVSSYCGFYLSGRLKKRRDFLRAMSFALSFVGTEIEFSHYELENIFRRIENSDALCGFFPQCIKEMQSGSVRRAWYGATADCAEKAALKNEDKEVLLQLADRIGMSDAEGQKNAIRRTVMHLDEYARSADEEYLRLSKPYRSCGILLGVFILIMIA